MKKSIFLFFAAILCAMTANAYNQSAKDLYFDNSEAKWNSCYVYIGHGTWTSVYPLTRVSGTQYLWKLSSNFNGGNSWNGATGWVLCYEKWWDSKGESIDKYTWHGDKNVTQKSISAWVDTKIYKTNGTASTKSDNHTINAYKVTSYTKSNYTVTINTATGGTLTVKDYDNNAVATGASKIHLTVLKFSATPADGYVLDGVEINDGTNTTTIAAADLATKTHTLTSAVTITPVWRATTSTVTVTATATNGTVTGGGVVEKGASVTLTATAADGYKFANWTVGGAEVSTANPYTFTAEEDVTVVANFEELPKETVYFVNNKNWTKVQAYVWNEGGNNGWPGQAMTATGEQVAGFDVYSYTAIEGNANVIFNDGSAQTADYVWTNGNYYYMGAAANYAGGTKEEVAKAANPDPLATEVYLAGDMNGWNQSSTAFRKATAEGTTASVSVELNKETYAFKIIDNGTWLGNNGTMTREYHEGWIFRNKQDDGVTDEGDAHITADFAGTYTFTWDMTHKKLTVTFPELPKYTVTTSATEGGSVTEGGEFTQGTEVALTATPAEGYHFEKWSNESTENPLTITVTEDVELQAIFAINVYDVTATAENGTVTGAGTYNHGEEVTLTATANDHYVFVNWTKGEEVVSTENPYTFNVTDDVDLVANFKLDTHTVTATATNGTVTGAGTYEHGATATLTATPAFDYEFVNWTVGEETITDNPLTITVTDNVTLEANFAEVAATTVTESGKFSISAHKTATFATGNLQYHTGNKTWRFAKQQYQVVGEQNIQLGHPDFTGWIDMLGYSADGKFGVNPSNSNADYTEQFVDWGTLFPEEGWSTLSKEDWKYLLEERTNADKLQQVAKVGDILGIMLFPDNWTLPKDCNPTPEINHDPDDGEETKYDFTTQNYTLEQWTKLEQAGAVFLPAAGRRTGGWGNTTLSENVPGGELDADGHYKHFDNCNEYAYYWTSTKVGENVNYLINCRLVDKPNDIYSVGAAHVDWAEKGRYGQSVRLAKVVYDKHTVNATAENGTVTGADADEYTHGTEITLTAIPAEHYVFVNWTAGETVLSTENPYIFTLEADVELKANFALDTHTITATAENGTVTGDGEYTHGTEVTLTATPAEGYEFVNWTVGEEVVAETAEYTFIVEADVNLVANFKKQIVHTDITAEDAIVRLIDGVLYFNGVLEDGTPYQVTLNEYTEVGDYTNISWTTYGEDEVEVVGAQANVTDEEGKLTLTATVTNETNSYGLTISGVLPAAEEDVKEVESLVYTLAPAKGSNSGYAGNCDITINDITWNLTGNSQMDPWRIGGKSITKVDRALYSKTPLAYNISKIEVTHGNASIITVNSFKLIISDEANGTGETIDVDFKASATTTIDLPEGDYTNKYFKFLYNVTNTNSSKNYFVEFTGAKFYATTTIEANPAPEAPAFTGEANFVGSTEVELTTTEENINIYYTLTDDYTLPTAGYMYAEPIELTETTTVKAIAHNTLTGKISEIAEKTFTKAEVYTITWSVNGDVSETTEVVQGNTLTLPADPTAPEACGSKVFMGWAKTSSVDTNGTDIEYVDNQTIPTGDATYYAVFAIQTAAGETEEIVDDYTMSDYTAGTQYATEEHKLDEKLTLYTVECHFTTQLRIYSSSTHNGYVYSNQLPAIIKSMSFTAGNKVDQLVVYGSTDGATWSEVGQISVTSTSYKTYELSFGNSDYTYFKLDVAGEQQIRISGFSITYKSGEAYTYSEYSTTCSGTGTDVENIEVKGKSVKMIVNGQLIIIKNGVTYNAQGQVVR